MVLVMWVRSSGTEIKELVTAWLAISFAFAVGFFGFTLRGMLISLFTIGVAFVLHELAHKLVAQSYGCWAEFRMDVTMLILMIIIAFFGVVFAAPGAVMIYGFITREQNGKISLAGPLMNLALVVVFFPLTLFNGTIGDVGRVGVWINSWIALFNLIPFGPLDGRKILAWDASVYSITLVAALGAFVFSMLL
ncbi:MAG: Zn-dependent protease [Candidatus Alkanophagales archaeon MCA70_species_1]|nr:Zn-dependent protease [Candidatus Alkanophaga volatiphilum]